VAAWTRRIDLTGHRGPEAILRRLVGPALALRSLMPGVSSLADLGSGAGFPGLPIALLDPTFQVTLVEARERRHHFQRHAIRVLAIQNATALLGRAESLPARPHGAVVAQAVGPPAEVLGWAVRWVEPGGLILVPGRSAGPETRSPEVEEARIVSVRPPLGEPEQPVWIGTRSAS
jgi:16S rRNA (guanine527-N7)-methyltransferase